MRDERVYALFAFCFLPFTGRTRDGNARGLGPPQCREDLRCLLQLRHACLCPVIFFFPFLQDIPAVVLEDRSLKRLEKTYLLVSIYDYDFSSRDDPLGEGITTTRQYKHSALLFASFTAVSGAATTPLDE